MELRPDVEIPRSNCPPHRSGGHRVNYGGGPCLRNRGISRVVQKTQVRPRNVLFTGWRPSFYGVFERSVIHATRPHVFGGLEDLLLPCISGVVYGSYPILSVLDRQVQTRSPRGLQRYVIQEP